MLCATAFASSTELSKHELHHRVFQIPCFARLSFQNYFESPPRMSLAKHSKYNAVLNSLRQLDWALLNTNCTTGSSTSFSHFFGNTMLCSAEPLKYHAKQSKYNALLDWTLKITVTSKSNLDWACKHHVNHSEYHALLDWVFKIASLRNASWTELVNSKLNTVNTMLCSTEPSKSHPFEVPARMSL